MICELLVFSFDFCGKLAQKVLGALYVRSLDKTLSPSAVEVPYRWCLFCPSNVELNIGWSNVGKLICVVVVQIVVNLLVFLLVGFDKFLAD